MNFFNGWIQWTNINKKYYHLFHLIVEWLNHSLKIKDKVLNYILSKFHIVFLD